MYEVDEKCPTIATIATKPNKGKLYRRSRERSKMRSSQGSKNPRYRVKKKGKSRYQDKEKKKRSIGYETDVDSK